MILMSYNHEHVGSATTVVVLSEPVLNDVFYYERVNL